MKQSLVYIVDDEPMVRRALKASVESLGVRVACFPSGQLCLEAALQDPCDLVITDLNMPEISGLQLIEKLREAAPLTAVIVVTGFGSVGAAVKSMQLGAVDFIEKPLDEDVILPKIRALLTKLHPEEGDTELSKAEEKVLQCVAEGLANKEIAFRLGRSIRTVENHRHRIMKKLGATSTADLVRIALSRR